MKHTPADWHFKVAHDNILQVWGVIEGEDQLIAEVGRKQEEHRRAYEDYARLIASAPELFDALHDLVMDYEDLTDSEDREANKEWHHVYNYAVAAINKVTGETE